MTTTRFPVPGPSGSFGSSPGSAPDAAAPPGLACPACRNGRLQVQDGEPAARCPACGHAASTWLVAEASWLLGERTRLVTRLDWVQGRIAAGDLTTPPPGTPPQDTTSRERDGVPLQTTLLGLGALLLVVAAIVFAAVAWDRLGATGQIALLAVVVGTLSGAAHALRRRYRATAETLATVGAAVATVAFVAAPRLGLGAGWMRDRTSLWVCAALAAVAVLTLAFGALSRLTAWRVATLVAVTGSASAGAFAAAGADAGLPSPFGIAGIAAAAAVLLGLAPPRTDPHGTPASVMPGTLAVGIALGGAAAVLALTGYDNSRHEQAWTLTWAVLTAAAIVAAVRLPGRIWPVLAGVAAAHVPVFTLAGLPITSQPQHDGALGTALLGLAVLGGITVAAATAPDTAWPATRVTPGTRALVRPGLLAFGIATWLLAVPMLDDRGWIGLEWGARYTGLIALLLIGIALWHRVTWTAWAAGATGCLAIVLLGGSQDWDHLPESITLSMGAILLTAGVTAGLRTRDGSRGTLAMFGPGLGMAIVPSALAAVDDAVSGHGPWRGAIVLAVGTALVLAGVLGRLAGPLAAGIVGVVIAGTGQLYALAALVPRWTVLAALGAVLVAAGFSLEHITRAGRHALVRSHSLR